MSCCSSSFHPKPQKFVIFKKINRKFFLICHRFILADLKLINKIKAFVYNLTTFMFFVFFLSFYTLFFNLTREFHLSFIYKNFPTYLVDSFFWELSPFLLMFSSSWFVSKEKTKHFNLFFFGKGKEFCEGKKEKVLSEIFQVLSSDVQCWTTEVKIIYKSYMKNVHSIFVFFFFVCWKIREVIELK